MFPLLESLLRLLIVISTSRPHRSLPNWLKGTFDLELETIGFYPYQVKAYVEKAFTNLETCEVDSKKVDKSLVRIPIQLDALCYTWDGFGGRTIPQTMTAVYKAIEQSLWQKDAVNLGKRTNEDARDALPGEIRNAVENEAYLLGVFAFTGMHNDVIDFESEHRSAILEQFNPKPSLGLDKTLQRLSFLRSSDPLLNDRYQTYHFLHFTFQEFFAARYFVQQWKAGHPLKCLTLNGGQTEDIEPTSLLRKHKYTARYDVFWRFVAGLLDAEGKAEGFFAAIEDKPRDLLGPTHQRLIMHCLSEVSPKMPLRRSLEETLKQWLLFECDFIKQACLASEVEFPEHALFDALQEESNVKITILRWLQWRPTIPSRIVNLTPSWLGDGESTDLKRAAMDILRAQSSLSDQILTAVVARVEDQDWEVRRAAVDVLRAQSSLSDPILTAVVACLEDQDKHIRRAAVNALGVQSSLSDPILTGVAVYLEDQDRDDWKVRQAVVDILRAQSSLSDPILAANVRRAAVNVLRAQSGLSDPILTAIAAHLQDQDWNVRRAAINATWQQGGR
ncbi:armadillo-type protein [Achaetomium macrosporum]|uniref:Armadillo-type protein n=1 Tax=Achaetomium macrosporum TaxID=79813 RepID=A0AAN7C0L0_9PEZI|nr:armadillo-type protein [Achaetomium macrosporum]